MTSKNKDRFSVLSLIVIGVLHVNGASTLDEIVAIAEGEPGIRTEYPVDAYAHTLGWLEQAEIVWANEGNQPSVLGGYKLKFDLYPPQPKTLAPETPAEASPLELQPGTNVQWGVTHRKGLIVSSIQAKGQYPVHENDFQYLISVDDASAQIRLFRWEFDAYDRDGKLIRYASAEENAPTAQLVMPTSPTKDAFNITPAPSWWDEPLTSLPTHIIETQIGNMTITISDATHATVKSNDPYEFDGDSYRIGMNVTNNDDGLHIDAFAHKLLNGQEYGDRTRFNLRLNAEIIHAFPAVSAWVRASAQEFARAQRIGDQNSIAVVRGWVQEMSGALYQDAALLDGIRIRFAQNPNALVTDVERATLQRIIELYAAHLNP